ncbi:MAG: 4-alpha-glucanotransferase, partial [Oscillospiraceae bacterium]
QVQKFRTQNSNWIEDYALYMAVKFHFGQRALQTWDEDIKLRKPQAMEKYKKLLQDDIDFWACLQYWFFEQWQSLRDYANQNGIKIIGDVPIYVALDSADVWANMDIFELDDAKNPIEVAGCPPDAFSVDGQLWGNPLYNWERLKEQNYAWWIDRVRACANLYDTVRIDHFRGFAGYYAIAFGEKTARKGEWKQGPGYALFEAIKNALGETDIIAEDLGFLTPDVIELVEKTGYPGMKILQFAFDTREESDFLPHNYTNNTVVYTGTHDNDTMAGWLKGASKEEIAYACAYLNVAGDTPNNFDFIRAIYASVSKLAIAQMQDFLEIGSEGRMNIPSTIGLNWKWRVQKQQLSSTLASKIAKLVKLYSR